MELNTLFLFSTYFILCSPAPSFDQQKELEQLDKELSYVDPAKQIDFLKEKLTAKDAKLQEILTAKDKELGSVLTEKGDFKTSIIILSCGKQLKSYMENFGRGFLLKIGRASDLFPGVNNVFTQIKGFVKKRFAAIQKSVFALNYLCSSKDQFVGATNGQNLSWDNQVIQVYRDLRKINICTSAQPDATTQNPLETILTNLILDFKASENESVAVEKFQQQCHSGVWSKVALDNTELLKLAIQAPEDEKTDFIHQLIFFNLSATEVEYVTNSFIEGTYFQEYRSGDFPEWYERCATVLYFSTSDDQDNFKEKLASKYGSKMSFGKMVDKFCFAFAKLYDTIRNEDIHQLPIAKHLCKVNSTDIYNYIEQIGIPAQKVGEYYLIASVVGLIAV